MEKQIYAILNDVSGMFSSTQLRFLEGVLRKYMQDTMSEEDIKERTSSDYIEMFLAAKRIEGCSEKTLRVYERSIRKLAEKCDKLVTQITTEDIRTYLGNYQTENDCSKVTMDNERRYISAFYSWLEEEDYVIKNPCKRIHKIRASITFKEVLSDEDIEHLRDNCTILRDLAMIDFLYSTGIRVGEIVELDIDDINFEERECIVHGKGDKERKVYFDAKTKIHLRKYLDSRTDDNPALFVTIRSPFKRLKAGGIEVRIREMGERLEINKVHPHKFRRSMATRAIDKGMPVEQLQKILGHEQIDTTMRYAIVNQSNVKASHKKFMS